MKSYKNKILLLMIGIPYSGKTKWIQDNGLSSYSINYNSFCSLFTEKVHNQYGEIEVKKISKSINKIFYNAIEEKMKSDSFIVVDKCHLQKKELSPYFELALKYGYQVLYKKIVTNSEEVIKNSKGNITQSDFNKYNQMLQNLKTPNQYIEYNHENNKYLPNYIPKNFPKLEDKYKGIYFIGDIQGCSKEIDIFFKKYYKEDFLYVFLGDLTDRGYDNKGVLEIFYKYLILNQNSDNIVMVKGNHDVYLEMYLKNIFPTGDEVFDNQTYPQIKGFPKKKLKKILKKFQLAYFVNVNGKNIFCCHGGVSKIENFIHYKELLKGSGRYQQHNISDSSFEKFSINQEKDYYLVHGHRNTNSDPINVNSKVFNLEGKVEFDGELRVVLLDKTTGLFEDKSIKKSI